MAELNPAPFADLVTRLFVEPRRQDSLFELPRRKWWLPGEDTPDMSVRFHGQPAGNPAGPAAGPHTQMAQNLLLSYAAGGRILELKTVQVLDTLEIARPCIDMATVGYNIEWSQELRVEQSLREYVAGAMLIAMFRREPALSAGRLDGSAGEVIYDISVGYDLKGIRSAKVCDFLAGMRDASRLVEALRAEIPRRFAAARDAEYATHLADTITLSTFHGCPADEIESICEFLIGELDFDVTVKMNPPTLGRERLEHLLHDVLGYEALRVNPKAYEAAIGFDESVALARRLTDFARQRGRGVGFKFSNTLEVINHRGVLPGDGEVMYLSGAPLHVITMALTDRFRQAVGPDVPISFSAGIDKQNFPLAVACGFCPITASTDLLRPGGYGRLGSYLAALESEMKKLGAGSIADYILRWGSDEATERRSDEGEGEGTEARRHQGTKAPRHGGTKARRHAEGGQGATRIQGRAGVSPADEDQQGWGGRLARREPMSGETPDPPLKTKPPLRSNPPLKTNPPLKNNPSLDSNIPTSTPAVRAAAVANTSTVAELAARDERYRAARNAREPKRIDSHLTIFDCITCNKCLPVCPNAANFTYPTPIVAFDYRDIEVAPDGTLRETGQPRRFEITRPMQIACYADFCNECGNCDTFCPEIGGPYIEKPTFFGSRETWQAVAPRDGFYIWRDDDGATIIGRVGGEVYQLAATSGGERTLRWNDLAVRFDADHTPQAAEWTGGRAPQAPRRMDMWAYHTLRHLLDGVLDTRRVNQVNAAWAACGEDA